MTTRKRIFVPGFFTHQVALDMFSESPDIELIWGVPEGGRTYDTAGVSITEEMTELVDARLREALPEIHALHAMGPTGPMRFGAESMDRAENLEVIFIQAAGADGIDLDAATDRGILVLNAPGANAAAVAEHAVGLMLALGRRIAYADRQAHETEVNDPSCIYSTRPRPVLATGKTLGLVGVGYVGRAISQIAKYGFDMKVQAFDPYADPAETERLGVQLVPLDRVLSSSDFVSLHAPLTPSTRGIIDERALTLMQPHSYLINTARGGLVDTDAITSALGDQAIAGAALDVTEPEPLPQGHPIFGLDNVILTPHIASHCVESQELTARISTELVLEALRGRRPRHLLNPDSWAKARVRKGEN